MLSYGTLRVKYMTGHCGQDLRMSSNYFAIDHKLVDWIHENQFDIWKYANLNKINK